MSTAEVAIDPRIRGLGASATVAVAERVAGIRAAGGAVFDFGLGQSPFPVPAPVVQALRDHAGEKSYLPVRGLPSLREAASSFLSRSPGVAFDPDQVIVGPGSKELLFLLQVVHEGELLVPTPGWVSYEPQARILGRHCTFLATQRSDDYLLDPDQLASHLRRAGKRSRILLLNYPSNPTSMTADRDRLRAIARVAADHQLLVLADEIYGSTQFDGRHQSIAAEYPEGTIVSTGLSKWCGAGGWRLGVMALPRALVELRRAMIAVASETFTSTSAPIQYAAVAAFRCDSQIETYLASVRAILSGLTAWFWSELQRLRLSAPKPLAGFYVFPDFREYRARLGARGIARSNELAAALLEEAGVAGLAGQWFGRSPEELTMRLSLVDFDGGAALAAAAAEPIDDDFVRAHCPGPVAGLSAIERWLGGLPS